VALLEEERSPLIQSGNSDWKYNKAVVCRFSYLQHPSYVDEENSCDTCITVARQDGSVHTCCSSALFHISYIFELPISSAVVARRYVCPSQFAHILTRRKQQCPPHEEDLK
jgi:hypothetical protein